MAKKPCALCGTQYNEGHLLFHDHGLICVACEAELEEAKEADSSVYAAMAGGPILSFAATMFMFGTCIPGLGKVIIAGTPFVGILAVFAGLRAIVLAWSAKEKSGPSGVQVGLLYASGIFAIFWSVPLSLLACAQLLIFVYAMGMQA